MEERQKRWEKLGPRTQLEAVNLNRTIAPQLRLEERYKRRPNVGVYIFLGRRIRNCEGLYLTLSFLPKAGRSVYQDSVFQTFPFNILDEKEDSVHIPSNLKS